MDTKGNVYYVGGINGVGKSTLLKEVTNNYPEIKITGGSAKFMEWLGIAPGDYEALRKLPDDYKNAQANLMMRELITIRTGCEALALDTHYLLLRRGVAIDVSSDWLSLVTAFVLVTASADVVLDRIKREEKTGRDRGIFPNKSSEKDKLTLIKSYLQLSAAQARRYSQNTGVPLLTIENNEGSLTDSVQTFIAFHQKMMTYSKNYD